ncbi:MAG: PIG-L family deacetylase [Acidimicrobiia bacterium]|nr:PIG-L family deacetylase [Acidimicrobiia bacterium]
MTNLARRIATTLRSPVRRAWQRSTIRRGRDVTAASARRSCLVLAPHPDDETLGCGATLARKVAAGATVDVVVVTDGRHSHRSSVVTPEELANLRATEATEAADALGVPPGHLRLLGWEEGTLGTRVAELTGTVEGLVSELAPDEILVTSGLDWQPDHRALNRAVRDLLPSLPPTCRVAEYPIWFWADGPWLPRPPGRSTGARAWSLLTDPFRATARARPDLVSTAGFLGAKRRALAAYRTQTTNVTGEPGWAVLDPEWLTQFLGPAEVFFPIT